VRQAGVGELMCPVPGDSQPVTTRFIIKDNEGKETTVVMDPEQLGVHERPVEQISKPTPPVGPKPNEDQAKAIRLP
jgi:hypothetical protein